MKFKKKMIFYKSMKVIVNYLSMYHRVNIKGKRNPLFDDFSKSVIGFKMGNIKAINFFFVTLDEMIPQDCIILPYVSAFAKQEDYESLCKLVKYLCINDDTRIAGIDWIIRSQYYDSISKSYKEEISPDSLSVDITKIQSIYNRDVILITDVCTNNINAFLSYCERLKKFRPKSVSLYAIAFYVET